MAELTGRSSATTKGVTLPNGIELPFVEQGDPAGVPVVFLHGYSDSWYSYERLLQHLPPSVHAFALTQRGHGDADRPESGYMLADFTGDVALFIEALELGPVIVVGHSMGSMIAQQFAIDYQNLTRGLVLIAAFIDFAGIPDIGEFAKEVEALTDPVDPDFVRAFQESTFFRPVPPAFLDRIVAESLKVPAYVWKAVSAGMMATNLSGQLDRITAPTLVIWGDQDGTVLRGDQDKLISTIPNARLQTYEGIGHGVHWEDPARVAADIVAFAEQLSN